MCVGLHIYIYIYKYIYTSISLQSFLFIYMNVYIYTYIHLPHLAQRGSRQMHEHRPPGARSAQAGHQEQGQTRADAKGSV